MDSFDESDSYFYNNRSTLEKVIGYKNVGSDLCMNKFCGNTILCNMYNPMRLLGNDNASIKIRDFSVIAGEIASYYNCTSFPTYMYNNNIKVHFKDYHFFKMSIKRKNKQGFILFSIICSINYVTVFIENYFIDEIPQKLKFAYLLYYYLCDFINEFNAYNNTNFTIDTTFKNRDFRNCLAHYGLGNFIKEKEIIGNDILKGLTNKAFNLDYLTTKKEIFNRLNELESEIEKFILK